MVDGRVRFRHGVALVGMAVILAGCAAKKSGPAGIYHIVEPGENLYRIGKAYGVSSEAITRVNKIKNPNRILVGQKLLIPGATRRLPVSVITPTRASTRRPARVDRAELGSGKFVWPVARGSVSSGFGRRGNSNHDGIDIAAPEGTPVFASRGGRVVFSDHLRGYGNVVIIEHGGGYATVYGHNRVNLVKPGDEVKQGQQIALLGMTGRTSGPSLHFEVRKNNIARNPLFFLPPQSVARAAATDG